MTWRDLRPVARFLHAQAMIGPARLQSGRVPRPKVAHLGCLGVARGANEADA